MASLYEIIVGLKSRLIEVEKLGRPLKFDRTRQEEFRQLLAEYNALDEKLESITRQCIISPLRVAEIISRKEGKPYRLKIFRETYEVDDKRCYTGRFIVCYLNEKNKFYNYEEDPFSLRNWRGIQTEQYVNYSMPEETYKEMLASLNDTAASLKDGENYILCSNADMDFVPTLSPASYIEGINFMKMFTYKTYYNDYFTINFQRQIRPTLVQFLESISIGDDGKEIEGETTL